MDPVLSAALRSWDFRIEVILILLVAGAVFVRGWWLLRQRTRRRAGENRWQAGASWRPIAYLSGLLILGITLMSPIDVLSTQLFTMHMIQHVLLVMIIPPLILLANPMPFSLWGLPKEARRTVGGWFSRGSRLRGVLKSTTGAGFVWLAYVIVIWGWHDPNAYNLALENSLVHDIEHITFLLVSMLFWWHIIGAGPRIHRSLSPAARFGFTLSAIPPIMIAGVAIVFAIEPIYPYYAALPRLWGISTLQDQRIAGIIMWVPGSMMYMIAALILVARWLQTEETKPWLPEESWATDEALAAPGIEK
jgi:cytochrome c oxidase assembly factor CtaG